MTETTHPGGWAPVMFLLVGSPLYVVTVWLYERSGGPITTGWFAIWAALVLIGLLAWVVVLRAGVRRVRRAGIRLWSGALARYVAIAMFATAMLQTATHYTKFTEDDSVVIFLAVLVVLAVGWAAAAPWTLLVWHTHDDDSVTRAVAAVHPPRWDDAGVEPQYDATAILAATAALHRTWRTIEDSAIAFAVILSTAVLNTGTLRLAALSSGATTEEKSPAVLVLAYGAFLAAVATALVAPLVVGWRTRATTLVDLALGEPPTGVPTAEYVETRDRFLNHLGLRAGVLRTPIAALSILAPFATAFLTTLVPTS
ncbi:hypothetical protein [Cellulomonas sp. Leaf334]|uniref:hypothetical protein n=1 Tax=Cellulomonas sp. Leaf334 TaxID=1736339 RepID=UPI0006FCC27C|nr:hypothetical protein [Cellulomonas sp. Leaf334]KQR11909.1 hypothetical protein ASF78_11960 [Cellulomonas sp. Leaf334]